MRGRGLYLLSPIAFAPRLSLRRATLDAEDCTDRGIGVLVKPGDRGAIAADKRFNALLQSFERFGVDLGLDRIQQVLGALGNPHKRVPIVHVAGTNGKGSVCAMLSAVLTQAGYRVGRYTSPHLVSWCERICVNDQPITAADLEGCLQQVVAAIDPQLPTPTQFEVFTAAAWVWFAQQSVDIAVVEVGLGGRLDATNVCDRPLVTVITSLSREHWQRLGPTLADIAREKAGILKCGCPAVIGQLPPEAQVVVQQRVTEMDCPVIWPEPAQVLETGELWYVPPKHPQLANQPSLRYSLALLGEHQQMNSALAIATLQLLRTQGWQISDAAIQQGLTQVRWPGRLQWLTWHDSQGSPHNLLIDGAHNPAAAVTLRAYLDTITTVPPATQRDLPDPTRFAAYSPGSYPPSITWIMGMLTTKDHADIFQALLRSGDHLHLVPVPDHLSADPNDLSTLAQSLCPDLVCQCHQDLQTALAVATTQADSKLCVVCGSLYLIGHLFAEMTAAPNHLTQ